MKILLIDTCGATGSIALEDTDLSLTIVASASLPGRTASERLVPMIKDLAEHAGITLPSLDAVAVVHGPGSFTGVRVGLSAAKGLCRCWRSRVSPCLPISPSRRSAQAFTLSSTQVAASFTTVYTPTETASAKLWSPVKNSTLR